MTTVAEANVGPRMTPVAWCAPVDLPFAQWVEQGRRLGQIGRSAGWWLGDWLAYGNAAYGERYARAARITGYDVQTLMNMVYVATHVDFSRRRANLSWSHHAEVVALPEDEQDVWLARADQERLSVRDLRQAMRGERRGATRCAKEPTARTTVSTNERVICPSCGHHFVPAETLANDQHEVESYAAA